MGGVQMALWSLLPTWTIELILLIFQRMTSAKKMHRSTPPKRALIEPYSSPTDTPTHCLEGHAADGSKTIAPSPSQTNAMSGFEIVAPSPSETNAPSLGVGSEIVAPSLAQTNASARSETIAPSPQNRTSGVGASSSRRVQGPTIGKATEKRIVNNNGNKLYIPITATFNALEGVLATPRSNESGLQVRRMCPIQGVSSWTVVDPATKGAVVQAVQV